MVLKCDEIKTKTAREKNNSEMEYFNLCLLRQSLLANKSFMFYYLFLSSVPLYYSTGTFRSELVVVKNRSTRCQRK